MKKIILYLSCVTVLLSCKEVSTKKANSLRDGFYQVNRVGVDSTNFENRNAHEVVLNYNSIYSEQEFTKVLIDTSDFVPLELEKTPSIKKDENQKSQLSITLNTEASKKITSFTATRIMKSVAIVLDGEAITMHKVRDTIKGGDMVISWCGENACQQLYTKIKAKVK